MEQSPEIIHSPEQIPLDSQLGPPPSPKHLFDDDHDNHHDEPQPPPENEHPNAEHPHLMPHCADTPPPTGNQTDHLPDTLFSQLYTSPASSPGLATTWLNEIQTNGPLAVASILSVVITISRPVENPPPDIITPVQVMQNAPQQTIHQIDTGVSEPAHGKVIVSAKDPFCRRIRRSYEDFWRRISAEAPKVVLYDTDCFETLIIWLEAMAAAPSRTLRFAACLAAYRLLDGLVEVGNKVRRSLGSMQRQLATEKRRCGFDERRPRREAKQLSKKGKELANKVDDLTANNYELVDLGDKIFVRIFVLKYRDVSAKIRQVSVSALGGWILGFPDYFLDDSNNKYIGWLLSDKDPMVRKSSLDCLLRMLKKKDFYSNLDLFLNRFSERIVEMTNDKDDTVCVAAIGLLSNLVEHNLIERDACEQICQLALGEPVTDIRRAAGDFLSRLLALTYNDTNNETAALRRSRSTRNHSLNVFNASLMEIPPAGQCKQLLKELLFVAACGQDDTIKADLAIDAIWDSFPAVRSWEAFSDLLQDDKHPHSASQRKTDNASGKTANLSSLEDEMDENDRALLAEMLLCSAKQSSGRGDPTRARLVEKGERHCAQTPGVLFGQHFLPILPKLLNQYQAHARTLRALIQLPAYFPNKTYEQEANGNNVSALVVKVMDILVRNTNSSEVAEACADTLRALRDDDNPLHEQVLSLLRNGCMAAVKDLTLHIQGDLSEMNPDGLSSALLRVRIFSELVDPGMSLAKPISKVFEYQEGSSDSSALGDDVATNCARIGSAIVMWALLKTKSRLEATEGTHAAPEEALVTEEVQELQRCGSQIISLLVNVVSSTTSPISVRVACLKCLLTPLSIVRGVEKYFMSLTKSDTSAHDPDFLGIKAQRKTIVHCIRSCLFAVLENELGIKDQNTLTRPQRLRKRSFLPASDLFDCFISLVAFSASASSTTDVSHLPLFGLLLKHESHDQESAQSHRRVHQLCSQYCQQQHIRGSSFVKDQLRVLREVVDLDATEQAQLELIRELAGSLVMVHDHNEVRISAAQEVLKSLLDPMAFGEGEDVWKTLSIVCCSGFGLLPFLSQDSAKSLQKDTKRIVEKMQNAGENCPHAESLEALHDAVQAVAKGISPDIPRSMGNAINRKSTRKSKKRRRNSESSRAYAHVSVSDRSNIRKSKRDTKKINYALLGGESSAEEQENYDDSDGDTEEEIHQQTGEARTEPSSTAEMARSLMQFENSPMPRTRKEPERIPQTPLRRRRRRKPVASPTEEPSPTEEQSPTEEPSPTVEPALVDQARSSSLPSAIASPDVRRSGRVRKASKKYAQFEGSRKSKSMKMKVVSEDKSVAQVSAMQQSQKVVQDSRTAEQEMGDATEQNEAQEGPDAETIDNSSGDRSASQTAKRIIREAAESRLDAEGSEKQDDAVDIAARPKAACQESGNVVKNTHPVLPTATRGGSGSNGDIGNSRRATRSQKETSQRAENVRKSRGQARGRGGNVLQHHEENVAESSEQDSFTKRKPLDDMKSRVKRRKQRQW